MQAPSVRQPQPTPVVPTEDPAVDEARRREQELAQKQTTRAATILTGGRGDTRTANVATKRLFGG